MANPSRYPSGISTFPQQHALNTFPVLPSQWQVTKGDDFIPFRQSTDYTATATGTGATAAALNWNAGAIKLTAGSTSTFKSFEALGANSIQVVPGNQIWHDVRIAMPLGSQTNPSTDSAVYVGLFDNVDPTSATNGIYFVKAAAATTMSFVVLKNSTATTFTNVVDLTKPSGIVGDVSSTAGTLVAGASGTTLAAAGLTVGTSGGGYRSAPLVVVNGTAGSGAQACVQLGGSTQGSFVSSNYVNTPTSGSGLFAPYVTAAGSGYTAGTFTVDVMPWINLQFWYDGKSTLFVGVNGRIVLSLGASGVTLATPGSTYSTVTSNSYNFSGTTLSTLVAPVQPSPGSFYVAAPQVALQLAFGLVGTTGNNRVMYVEEINVATELN